MSSGSSVTANLSTFSIGSEVSGGAIPLDDDLRGLLFLMVSSVAIFPRLEGRRSSCVAPLEAINFVLEKSSRATGRTGTSGCWNAIRTQPFHVRSVGMNWSASSSNYIIIRKRPTRRTHYTYAPSLISYFKCVRTNTRIATLERLGLHDA